MCTCRTSWTLWNRPWEPVAGTVHTKFAHLFTYKTEKINIRSMEQHLDLDQDGEQPALQWPLQRWEVSWIFLWVHSACVCKDIFLHTCSHTRLRRLTSGQWSTWIWTRTNSGLDSSPSRGERFLGSFYGCTVLVFVRIYFCLLVHIQDWED